MKRYFRDDALFNVDMNGARVATGITRDEAEVYLNAWRETRVGSCYVYLMDRPLAGRPPAWREKRIKRVPSLRVSAATRQRLTDQLLADGILQPAEYATGGEQAEQVAA